MIGDHILATVHFTSTITLGAIVIAIATAVVGTFAIGAARAWKDERDAAVAKADRLAQELTDEKVRALGALAEQQEIRHDLKAELANAKMRGDQTPVLKSVQQILERLTNAEQSGVEAVAKLIEAMDARAAERDQKIVETQERIAVSLERVAERIAEKVGEVVQEKVDQLQANGDTDKEGTS